MFWQRIILNIIFALHKEHKLIYLLIQQECIQLIVQRFHIVEFSSYLLAHPLRSGPHHRFGSHAVWYHCLAATCKRIGKKFIPHRSRFMEAGYSEHSE